MKVVWERVRVRLLFMGIGLALGAILSLVVANSYTTRIEELEAIRKEQLLEKTQTIAKLETKYSKIETEYKKMKSHVQITERTKPDGSTERIYDSKRSVESEKQVVEHQLTIQRMEHTFSMERLRWEYEKRRIEESRPSVSANIGYNSDFSKFLYLNYAFYGPATVGLYGDERGTYGMSIGISF